MIILATAVNFPLYWKSGLSYCLFPFGILPLPAHKQVTAKRHHSLLSVSFIQGSNFRHPPFRNCHAATVTETGRDTLLCAWFGGDYEGSDNTAIWGCFRYLKKKKQWGTVQLLVAGKDSTGHSKACWNPVLYKTSGGILFLYYKTGSNLWEWRGKERLLLIMENLVNSWAFAGLFLAPSRTNPATKWRHPALPKQYREHRSENLDYSCWKHRCNRRALAIHSNCLRQLCCYSTGHFTIRNGYAATALPQQAKIRSSKPGLFDNGNTWSALHPLDLPNPIQALM